MTNKEKGPYILLMMKMKSENKKISVIIPVYNGEKYIEEAILSVLNQDYKNKELIVLDDCSGDNSRAIISDLNKNHDFLFIKNRHNLGLSRNLNEGIRHTHNSDYLFILQNDCVLKNKDYLTRVVKTFKKDEKVGAITGKPEIKDLKKIGFIDKLNISLYLSDIIKNESGKHEISFIEGRADAYRFDLIKRVGFFEEKLKIAGEDLVVCNKIRRERYQIIQDNDLVYHIGYGGNQDSYLKLLIHLFKMANGLPYVIKKYGFEVASKKILTKNRKMRKNLRFTQCLSLFLTVVIILLTFFDIRFLWMFALLWGWRIIYYLDILYPAIRFKWIEKIIYVFTGILSDYFYSFGVVYGSFFIFINKRI